MEHSIVSDFENLQVLASCDFHKMDRMVQDLTNALEETERPPPRSCDNPALHARGGGPAAAKKHVSASKKHRCKKRKSTQNIWECGNLGEASESSLDEAFRDYMESVPHGSDSDEFALTVNRLQLLASFANTALSLAESDSFNETLSPMRAQAQRRRRKLKRMAVDPHPDAGIYGDKCCHLKEKLTHSRRLAAGDAGGGGDRSTVHGSLDTLPGKRKRGMRDKGGNSYEVEREGEEAAGGGDDAHMECSNNNERSSSVSSFSSSDSDGIITNDDARDGDDEQSDFFHENGPACGIPGIIPWWESEGGGGGGDSAQRDENFEKILNGVFEYLPAASRRSFNMRLKLLAGPEREIRAGQRRLKDRSPAYSLSCFLQDRQQWSDNTQLFSGARQNGTNSDNKRRRRTPPNTPTEEGFVGGDADPIPETNIGNRLLQSMGWTPGTGLGSKGAGIKNPIMAYRRHGRKGLGTRKGFPLPPTS